MEEENKFEENNIQENRIEENKIEEPKVEEKKKSKAGIIIVIIVGCLLLVGLIIFVTTVIAGVSIFKATEKQIEQLQKTVLVGMKETTIKDETKKCFDTYSYKELTINGKVVDLGVNTKEDLNQCYVSSVESYKKADDFIVVNVEKNTNSDGNYATYTLFLLDNTGKIIKSISKLDDNPIYNLTYSLEDNKITINAFSKVINSLVPAPCSEGENNIVAGIYEVKYLGNNSFSDTTKIKAKSYGEYLKENNMKFSEVCTNEEEIPEQDKAIKSYDVGAKEIIKKFETGMCSDQEYHYNILTIDDKEIDLGLNPKAKTDECWVATIVSYRQAKEFIVVKIQSEQWEFDGSVSNDSYYIVDNNGSILKKIEKLGNDIIRDSSYSLTGDTITITNKINGNATYKIEYQNNGKFSDVKKVK